MLKNSVEHDANNKSDINALIKDKQKLIKQMFKCLYKENYQK